MRESEFIVGGSGSPGGERRISLINAPRVSIVINGDKKEEGSEGGAGESVKSGGFWVWAGDVGVMLAC